MREIKFRAWVPRPGKFFLWGVGDINNDGANFSGPPADPSAIHEQYTCLKDKNSKEIYEGDIVMFHDQSTFIVAWLSLGAGFALKDMNISSYMGLAGVNTVCSVIGNIHEHDHLLEDGQNG